MADTSTTVSGDIRVSDNSFERVAFELMQHIANWEDSEKNDKSSRDYWLKLYMQCRRAAHGSAAEAVLQRL